MPAFNPLHWRRTTLAGGLSEQAAEDTAAQLHDAFADTSSRQELREVIDAALDKHDLRIIRWIFRHRPRRRPDHRRDRLMIRFLA